MAVAIQPSKVPTIFPLSMPKFLKFLMFWMDLEGIMLSEISQSEKNKYCMISLMWNPQKLNS